MNAETVKQENQEDLDKKEGQEEVVAKNTTDPVDQEKPDSKTKEAEQGSAAVSNLRVLENIEVKDKNIINNIEVKKSIKYSVKLMKGQGRILARKSGTESKIRIMGESENKKLLHKCINIIKKKIK